jgi:acetylglutamate kinase
MKKILIKVSGDVNEDKIFLNFVNEKSKENKIVIICGAGSQINKVLIKQGYKINFGKHGRIIKSLRENDIVKKILEEEKKKLREKLNNNKVYIKMSFLYIDDIFCHVNADELVKTYYLGFDEIYVFTLKERIKSKEEIFKNYSKVKIIGV